MRKGFTLVELSIVLVIIGLLIGDILVAQSMISTTKIQKVLRQIVQYDTGISNFQTKYNQLPGDTNLFSNPGNNNGLMFDSWSYHYEAGAFWNHLSLGIGLKNSLGTDYQAFDVQGVPAKNINCAILEIDQDTSSVPCLLPIVTGRAGWSGSFYFYLQPNHFYDTAPKDPLLTKDTMAIDLKIDDGAPLTGSFIGERSGASTPGGATSCVSLGKYNISNQNYGCSFFLRIGAQVGNEYK